MKKCLLLVCMVFALTNNAYSATFIHKSKLERIGIANETYATIQLETVYDTTGHPCAVSDKRISLDISSETGRLFFTLLLTAQTTYSEVEFHIDRDFCGLWGTQPLIKRAYIIAEPLPEPPPEPEV